MDNRMSRKAQVSMEFMFLIVLGFMIMLVFSVVAKEQMIDAVEKKQYIMLKDIALMVQTEINSASSLENGFERIFYVPENIDFTTQYDIRIVGNYLIANLTGNEVVLMIQGVNGDISKGNNTLTKSGGELYLS